MFCDFRHKRLLVCTKVSPVLVAASAGQLGSPRFCSCPVWVPLTSPLLLPILPNCVLLCFHLQSFFFFPIISLPNSFPQNYTCFSIAKDNSAADTNKDAKAPKCPTPLGADGIGSTPTVGRAQRSLRTESWGGSWRNSSGSWPQTGP